MRSAPDGEKSAAQVQVIQSLVAKLRLDAAEAKALIDATETRAKNRVALLS